MPATITLKNIPDEVYERLKASAAANRRSLNSEVIVCLEAVLLPGRVPVDLRLQRARALRARLAQADYSVEEIDQHKRRGRA